MTNLKFESHSQIFWFSGPFMYNGQPIQQTEKALKLKVQSFVCYPGVTDKIGQFSGFTWVPKSVIKLDKNGHFELPFWFSKKIRLSN